MVLRTLSMVVASILLDCQLVSAFSSSTYESVSTLDAYVPIQDWESQKTLLDLVDSGLLDGRKPLIFRSQGSTSAPKQAKPLKPRLREEQKSTAAKASPFRKWIKPQPGNVEIGKVASGEPKFVTPKIARQSPREPQADRAKPLPKSKNQSTTVQPTAPTKKLVRSELPTFLAPISEPTHGGPISADLPPLSTSQRNLRKKVRGVLTHYYNRPLNTRDRSPWELMHAMLAFEAHSKVLQGGPNGKPITAVGWLCYNRACKRRTLMYVDDDGELKVRVGPALQGHRGQLLAMLAQSRISQDYPMLVEGHQLKIADLIEMEKRTCYPRTELTFKLIGLLHYLDTDATWLNDQGMQWDIPRLVAEELRQPIRGAACGGTHRLSGLTLAYKTRQKRGEPVDGEYRNAQKFVQRYQQYAYRLQNRDGSFSTEWFRGPGNENSLDRKLKTTGHILEWLLYAATDKELRHWRTTKAVNFLANIMHRNRYKDWESGPLGHAIHALVVYDRLMFAPYDQAEQSPIATKPRRSNGPRQNR